MMLPPSSFSKVLFLLILHTCLPFTISFSLLSPTTNGLTTCNPRYRLSLDMSTSSEGWNGEVVSNSQSGTIRGCIIRNVEGTKTDWIIEIDGKEADLGKFSDAIYRKITSDAKQQNFQGFRPGTIPPHLLGSYITFSMDECAREATLEAMQQNNIRPFEDTRETFKITSISISPPKKKTKKKKGKRKKNTDILEGGTVIGKEPEWATFDSMKEAIAAGWKPGQTFSFTASNVKGQKVLDQNLVGAKAIGAGGSGLDLNNMIVDIDDL